MSHTITSTEEALIIRARQEALRRPDLGRKVRVVKGRKVPKGTEGVVFYNRIHPIYNGGRLVRNERRIGFHDASGVAHFTNADNVEVVGAE